MPHNVGAQDKEGKKEKRARTDDGEGESRKVGSSPLHPSISISHQSAQAAKEQSGGDGGAEE